jgi:glutamate-1-semialdehyde 2,1-aminomutase
MKATLGEVLTQHAFDHMIALCNRFTEQVQNALHEFNVGWSVNQLGARAEYRFTHPTPINGTQSMEGGDDELDEFMHLYMCNRGILMTPFHNMALMCPTTVQSDVDEHGRLFVDALKELTQVS